MASAVASAPASAAEETTALDALAITIISTAAVPAPAVMPMMSGLASALRASDWKIAPDEAERDADEQRRQSPRQPQRLDDQLGLAVAEAEDGRDDVAERHRVRRRC